MKYLVFAEWDPEDFNKVIKKVVQHQAEIEKNPDKFPSGIFPPHQVLGKHVGVNVFEGTEEQITNLALHYTPEVKLKLTPIAEFATTAELWQKMKK